MRQVYLFLFLLTITLRQKQCIVTEIPTEICTNCAQFHIVIDIVTENGRSEKRWSKLICNRSITPCDRLTVSWTFFWLNLWLKNSVRPKFRSQNMIPTELWSKKFGRKKIPTNFLTEISVKKIIATDLWPKSSVGKKTSDWLSDRNFGHKRVELVKKPDASLFWLTLLRPNLVRNQEFWPNSVETVYLKKIIKPHAFLQT